MELTHTDPRQLFAALEPEERMVADATMVRSSHGLQELHVTVGPVTFRLLDQAGLDALRTAYAAARALAEGAWTCCSTCGAADALVELIDGRPQHLACCYTDREAYPYDGAPPARISHLRVVP